MEKAGIGAGALLQRIGLARSILGHAPESAHVLMALRALDGAGMAELVADKRWHGTALGLDGPRCPGCLIAWGDGWRAGHDEGIHRRAALDGEGA